jgi:two-component system, cell cycle sensor histidine kinase and response regulator CckA
METILIVEDEEMLLELLETILAGGGYNVLKAKDGMEAIDIYKSHEGKIDLILSDMGLPRLGGWEMFQQIHDINPSQKAILASGYLDPKLREEIIDAGAMDFVQKPYEPDIILTRIREVLDYKSS